MLSSKEKKQLKSKAHNLSPVVILGQNGLTENVLKEIDKTLLAHELIKIRLPSLEKSEKTELAKKIVNSVHADLIQIIGHIIVIYRSKDIPSVYDQN